MAEKGTTPTAPQPGFPEAPPSYEATMGAGAAGKTKHYLN